MFVQEALEVLVHVVAVFCYKNLQVYLGTQRKCSGRILPRNIFTANARGKEA